MRRPRAVVDFAVLTSRRLPRAALFPAAPRRVHTGRHCDNGATQEHDHDNDNDLDESGDGKHKDDSEPDKDVTSVEPELP